MSERARKRVKKALAMLLIGTFYGLGYLVIAYLRKNGAVTTDDQGIAFFTALIAVSAVFFYESLMWIE